MVELDKNATLLTDGEVTAEGTITTTVEPTVEDAAPILEMGELSERDLDLVTYHNLLTDAHDSMEGKNISDLPLSHSYWGMMNNARAFAQRKGL